MKRRSQGRDEAPAAALANDELGAFLSPVLKAFTSHLTHSNRSRGE